MTHLIPEKRMDVNGHMVTRHVLPPSLQTKAVSMPPPNAMSEVEQKYALASSIANDLFTFDGYDMIDANGDESHEYTFEEAVDALSDMLPNHVLKEIKQSLPGG